VLHHAPARRTRLGWGQTIYGDSAPILLKKSRAINSRDRLICVGAPESDEDSRSSVRSRERRTPDLVIEV
jgi:hypothetical protein